MPDAAHDRRDAALVALAAVAAVLLAWPFADMPFNDDASYALTVRQLATTGHLTYNGWATAASIAHDLYGAAWVRAAGAFSFDLLRVSTLPLAAGAAALCHALGRRLGLRPAYAVLAALTLALSPLFVPLAASFMTDVPGLFYTLLALYGLVRATDAPGRSAVGWAALAIVAGAAGGTARQIVWVAPLAGLPVLAWTRRRDAAVVVTAAAGWAATVAVAALTVRWFDAQPYALAEPPLGPVLGQVRGHPAAFAGRVLALVPTTVALALPAAAGLLGGWRRWPAVAAAGLFAGLLVLLKVRPSVAIAPWMGNVLLPNGILGFATIGGARPLTLAYHFRQAVSVATFAAIAAIFARHCRRLTMTPGRWVLLAFAAGYVVLLLPRCARAESYDRYVLPLIPCLAIPLLLAEQDRRARPSAAAWGLLLIFAAYAVATTQELWAMNRARVAAVNALGVPRTAVSAGFDYDLWTELATAGHVNSTRITNPPGTYRPGLGLTPSIHARYRIEVSTRPATGAVPFTTALPPFHRWVVAVPIAP